jgi:hypothetical protein
MSFGLTSCRLNLERVWFIAEWAIDCAGSGKTNRTVHAGATFLAMLGMEVLASEILTWCCLPQ